LGRFESETKIHDDFVKKCERLGLNFGGSCYALWDKEKIEKELNIGSKFICGTYQEYAFQLWPAKLVAGLAKV